MMSSRRSEISKLIKSSPDIPVLFSTSLNFYFNKNLPKRLNSENKSWDKTRLKDRSWKRFPTFMSYENDNICFSSAIENTIYVLRCFVLPYTPEYEWPSYSNPPSYIMFLIICKLNSVFKAVTRLLKYLRSLQLELILTHPLDWCPSPYRLCFNPVLRISSMKDFIDQLNIATAMEDMLPKDAEDTGTL